MNDSRTFGLAVSGLAVLVACGIALIQPLFFSAENLANVLRQSVPLVIFALAQTIPLVTRGLDLSQGGIIVATSVAYALLAGQMGSTAAVLPALTVGLATGCVSGALIAWLEISPFVVTLGIGSVLQGLALVAADGQPVSNVPADFSALYYGSVAGLPLPVALAILLVAVSVVLLDHTVLGRRIRAVGSNPRAAFLSGIPVRPTLLVAYGIAGLGTSFGAVLLSARISSGHPTAGSGMALQAVAAAVIGGVSLFGGRGTMLGATAGAILLTFVSNALNILNVSSFLQLVAVGLIIIVAAVVDRARHNAIQRLEGKA